MTYILPQDYKCPSCKTVTRWSPQHSTHVPSTSEGNPICPICWDKFLSTLNIEIESINDYGGGSNYEKRYGKD